MTDPRDDISKKNRPVETVVTRARDASERRQDVCVEDLVSAMGRASFQPLLLLPALAVVSPLSAIPFFSSFCGMMILLISGQMAVGRKHLWLPGMLARKRVRARRVRDVFDQMIAIAQWVDDHSKPRLQALQRPPLSTAAQIFCALCGALMPVLEFVPMTSSLLGVVVALLSLSMLTRDGLLGLVAVSVCILLFGGALTAFTT